MSSSTIEHPEELLPWLANGTLELDEKLRLEEHLRGCSSCRHQLQELEELRRAVKQADSPAAPARVDAGLDRLLGSLGTQEAPPNAVSSIEPKVRRRIRYRTWLPLAAIIIMAMTVALPWWRGVKDSPPPSQMRTGNVEIDVRSDLPSGQSISQSHFELRWLTSPGWSDARFSIYLTTSDLTPVTEAHDLTATRFQVPKEELAGVPHGARLLWRVEAIRDDGTQTSSPTFFVILDRQTVALD